MQAPRLNFWPDSASFWLQPSEPMADEGARSFSPYPADFENAELFNIRAAEFSWPEMSDEEFRPFLMFLAANLHIHADEKMTLEATTKSALVRMAGSDNVSIEDVVARMIELQRACA